MRRSIDHDAAYWALTLRDPQASFEDIDRALNWICSSADRQSAFDRAERFLKACDDISSRPAEKADLVDAPFLRDRFHWAPNWKLAIAASLAIFLVGAGFLLFQDSPVPLQPAQIRYTSSVGEIRTFPLPDGSKVTLGGASAVTIAFGPAARRIILNDGEAYFDVAPDRARPFVVAAGTGTVTAVGTAFDVHRKADNTTITVVHGVVDVVSQKPEFLTKRRLSRAMQVSYSGDAQMSAVGYVNLQTAMGWRQGELNFYNQPLAAAVADLNRYSSSPIIINDDALRMMPVTGAVKVNGILEWLRGLAMVMDFDIVQHPDRIELKVRRVTPPSVATVQGRKQMANNAAVPAS